jgi:CheY-like chemotaxis protein
VNDPLLAVKTALEFRPDVFLLDVDMPGLDGGSLASQLREHPVLKSIPIVILSALVRKKEAGIIGGLPMMAKPAGVIEIMACLDGVLASSPDARAKVG